MIKVGIIGAAGYTGGESIRLLLNHPGAILQWALSSSSAGKPLSSVHTDLEGQCDMSFVATADFEAVDVIFLCVGHGDARKYMDSTTVPQRVKVVDFSQDYRIEPNTDGFVYGLTELNGEAIRGASRIANPGCFATAIQLTLLPLAQSGLIRSDIHISAITGSTGAGQSLSATSHFSWRENNISIYKPFTHQHLREVSQMLSCRDANADVEIDFIPYRGDFTRGILASVYTKFEGSIEEARELYSSYYACHPFTSVSLSNIALKQVVNTNKCLLYLEKHGDKLLIVSAIDNLLKGAAGQAVENMNLIFGIDQMAGLRLKPQAF